jgi:hypothetical protein
MLSWITAKTLRVAFEQHGLSHEHNGIDFFVYHRSRAPKVMCRLSIVLIDGADASVSDRAHPVGPVAAAQVPCGSHCCRRRGCRGIIRSKILTGRSVPSVWWGTSTMVRQRRATVGQGHSSTRSLQNSCRILVSRSLLWTQMIAHGRLGSH